MRKEKIHEHAKVSNVKKTIAKELGIAEGAIMLVNPDGKKAKGDLQLKNLNKKFNS